QPGDAERLGQICVPVALCAGRPDAADAFALHRQCERAAAAGDDAYAAGGVRHLVRLDALAGAEAGWPRPDHRRLAVADVLLPDRHRPSPLPGNLRDMLERIVERSVAWAIAHAKFVIVVCLALTVAAAIYSARTLKMDSDTANMISPSLP